MQQWQHFLQPLPRLLVPYMPLARVSSPAGLGGVVDGTRALSHALVIDNHAEAPLHSLTTLIHKSLTLPLEAATLASEQLMRIDNAAKEC